MANLVDQAVPTLESKPEIKVALTLICSVCRRELTLTVYGAPVSLAIEIVEGAGWELSPICVCPVCQNGHNGLQEYSA